MAKSNFVLPVLGGAIGIALILGSISFTTINTGENGLYVGFDGQVKPEVITPGIKFEGLGSIKTFNTRKITVSANDLRPKTKDNTIMKEMDVTVTYSINPTSLYELYTGYDFSNHTVNQNSGQLQLMSSYISRLITSAVNQSVDEFPALDVNSSLDKIQDVIKNNLTMAIAKNGLEGKIMIDSVMIGTADLPDSLVDSVNRVVAAQSAKKEQEEKTATAALKAKETEYLSSTLTPQYLEYQRNLIMKEAMENGNIQKIIINGAPMSFMPVK